MPNELEELFGGKDAYKEFPPLILSPPEIAWLVKDTINRYDRYPKLDAMIAPEKQAIAIAIILAESGGNVYALNKKPPDLSYGLAQINMLGPLGPNRRALYGLKENVELYKADVNVHIMAKISASGNNFRPWSTYTSGAYKKHMPVAENALKNPMDPSGKLKTPEETSVAAQTSRFDEFLVWVNKGVLRGATFAVGLFLIFLAFKFYTNR